MCIRDRPKEELQQVDSPQADVQKESVPQDVHEESVPSSCENLEQEKKSMVEEDVMYDVEF